MKVRIDLKAQDSTILKSVEFTDLYNADFEIPNTKTPETKRFRLSRDISNNNDLKLMDLGSFGEYTTSIEIIYETGFSLTIPVGKVEFNISLDTKTGALREVLLFHS